MLCRVPGCTGRAHRAPSWDESYERASAEVARLFAAGRPIVGLCASGILIRSVAPLLAAKREEPPLVAVAEDGSIAVPLVGGHHGANALARALAALTGGVAAITTAGDLRLGLALDEPPPGWHIANPERVKPVAAALLRGDPVALVAEAGGAEWLHRETIRWAEQAERRVVVTDRAVDHATDALVFHPPVLALGIGCERGCPAEEIAELARASLAEAGLAAAAIAAVVSVELKLAEPGLHELATALGVPARFFSAARLLAETPHLSERSAATFRATGCWGVAEGAALAAAGPGGVLVVPKRKSRRATCAVARAPAPIDPAAIGRARGKLAVVGIGPGLATWRTPEASAALAQATDIVGYRLYLDLLGRAIDGKSRHASALGEEEARACQALDLAAEGRSVALVSSGDAGIYGLAALVFELLDRDGKTGVASRRALGLSRDLGIAGRCRPRGGAARPRFLRDLALRPDDAMGDDPGAARSRGGGRFRRGALQSALGAPAGAARRGGRDPAAPSPAANPGFYRPQSRPRRGRAAHSHVVGAGGRRDRHAEHGARRQQHHPPARRGSAPALHAARLSRAQFRMTVHFIGAGPGAPDLITVRGLRLIERCRVCLYAGSLVPREIVAAAPPDARVIDTAPLTLDEIIAHMAEAHAKGLEVARLHSGDPSLYGAIAEQKRRLTALGIPYDVTPGVPSFAAAAAALGCELTVPEVAQTVILTRTATRSSPMPEGEALERLAASRATLAIHLSIANLARVVRDLIPRYGEDCPAIVACRVSWPDELLIRGTLADIRDQAKAASITRTALVLVGRALAAEPAPESRLYAADHHHLMRPRRV